MSTSLLGGWYMPYARPCWQAFSTLALGLLLSQTAVTAKEAARPNVIFIMTDNHSPWTLGCYGNKDVKTPHIDKMAAQGHAVRTLLFEQRRVLADTGQLFDGTDALPTRCSPLPWGPRSPDRPASLQHARRIRYLAVVAGRGRLCLRTVGQVASGGQPASAGRVQLLDNQTPRPQPGLLRSGGHRARRDPQGARIPHAAVDRSGDRVHREESRSLVLFVPGIQRTLRARRRHARAAS